MMICTRCQGTGFLNIQQVPEEIDRELSRAGILKWMRTTEDHDVTVCDCCGDGNDWYGEAGKHYTDDDPAGRYGPYAYNGGLCECD